jgi:DHA2 family multidrug resistance protein
MDQARSVYWQQSGDAAASQQAAVMGLANLRLQQAAGMAYLDVFWITGVVAAALLVLVLFMKRSVAEKGEHIGAE